MKERGYHFILLAMNQTQQGVNEKTILHPMNFEPLLQIFISKQIVKYMIWTQLRFYLKWTYWCSGIDYTVALLSRRLPNCYAINPWKFKLDSSILSWLNQPKIYPSHMDGKTDPNHRKALLLKSMLFLKVGKVSSL